jgi:hypothetical protein
MNRCIRGLFTLLVCATPLLLGCSKRDPKNTYRVTEVKILRGEASKVRDGYTYVFTAVGDDTVIRGESVNLVKTGNLLCRASSGTVWISADRKDCSNIDPLNSIAEITDEKAR